MAEKRKKQAEEPEPAENLERWLLTYADMITLL
ncbi:MAG: flagellar motor protein MotB, partial [Lentisphaerae bacterium]|nr:flagellar motor protein MotB [Lentisphaerota bacterium]